MEHYHHLCGHNCKRLYFFKDDLNSLSNVFLATTPIENRGYDTSYVRM